MFPFFNKYFKYFLLFAVISIPLLGHLEALTVRVWDEARLAQSAMEMYERGNYLVVHCCKEPDLWNTKPPLMIWAQVLCMHLVGPGELAVRIPSVLAVLLTCTLLIVFLNRITKKTFVGIFAVLILMTSAGFVTFHAARTGDYDAPLTLFSTLSLLGYFTFLESNKSKYLHVFFVALTIGILIKSVSILLFVPALFVYTLIDKKLIHILKKPAFYIGIAYSTFFVLLYYLSREYYNAGYIEAVIENELGGRFLSVIENHHQPFSYYFQNLLSYQYSYWCIFTPLGVVMGLKNSSRQYRRFTLFILIATLSYLLIISAGQTKVAWYTTPTFPLLAILNANVLWYARKEVINFFKNPFVNNWASALVIILFVSWPYKQVFDKNYMPKESGVDIFNQSMCEYLKQANKEKRNIKDYKIIYEDYHVHVNFYVDINNRRDMNIKFIQRQDIKIGDRILVHTDDIKEFIKNKYQVKYLDSYLNIVVLEILKKK